MSFKVALRPCRGLCVLLWLFVWLCVLAEGFCVHLWLKWVVVVDEGAPRVDAAGELVLHDDILHPRESHKLNASMIPTILINQRHDQLGMYSTKD